MGGKYRIVSGFATCSPEKSEENKIAFDTIRCGMCGVGVGLATASTCGLYRTQPAGRLYYRTASIG
jgi:hypothetical protein